MFLSKSLRSGSWFSSGVKDFSTSSSVNSFSSSYERPSSFGGSDNFRRIGAKPRFKSFLRREEKSMLFDKLWVPFAERLETSDDSSNTASRLFVFLLPDDSPIGECDRLSADGVLGEYPFGDNGAGRPYPFGVSGDALPLGVWYDITSIPISIGVSVEEGDFGVLQSDPPLLLGRRLANCFCCSNVGDDVALRILFMSCINVLINGSTSALFDVGSSSLGSELPLALTFACNMAVFMVTLLVTNDYLKRLVMPVELYCSDILTKQFL
jgi:hypothetical protein